MTRIPLERWKEGLNGLVMKTCYPITAEFYLVSFYNIDKGNQPPQLGFYNKKTDQAGFFPGVQADHFNWVISSSKMLKETEVSYWLVTKNNSQDMVTVYKVTTSIQMQLLYTLKLPKSSYWPLKAVRTESDLVAIPTGNNILINHLTDGQSVISLAGMEAIAWTGGILYYSFKKEGKYYLLKWHP